MPVTDLRTRLNSTFQIPEDQPSSTVQSIVASGHKAPWALAVTRPSPIEQTSELLLLGKVSLDLNSVWIVIGNESSITAYAVRRACLPVDQLLGTRPWQLTVLECSLIAARRFESLVDVRCLEERAAIYRDAQRYLGGWDSFRSKILDR